MLTLAARRSLRSQMHRHNRLCALRYTGDCHPFGTRLVSDKMPSDMEKVKELKSIVDVKQWPDAQRSLPFAEKNIRNFFVCAHIDHGKSTLSDRMMELCGNIDRISDNKREGQVLDKLDVERERGITVKAQSVSLVREINGEKYLLNLIDTPGHVDFQYEVSRSLAACTGALLLVDASEGVQAQTVSNFRLAEEAKLDIVPCLTKIDQPHADRFKVLEEIEDVFHMDFDGVIHTSAKTGEGIDELWPAITERIRSPPPALGGGIPQALVFDCWFDMTGRGRGVVCLVIVQNMELKVGDQMCLYHASEDENMKWDEHVYEIQEIGVLTPEMMTLNRLTNGQVGYIIANIRNPLAVRAGETLFVCNQNVADVVLDHKSKDDIVRDGPDRRKISQETLQKLKDMVDPAPGFEEAQHKVYAGVFPAGSIDFTHLDASLHKLFLSDTSISFTPEYSHSLGQGFRLGFLGALHMDVFMSRLEDDFDCPVICTAPSVPYYCHLQMPRSASPPTQGDGDSASHSEEEVYVIDSPSKFPQDAADLLSGGLRNTKKKKKAKHSNKAQLEAAAMLQRARMYFTETWVESSIMSHADSLGNLLELIQQYKGELGPITYPSAERVSMTVHFPLSEIIFQFHDQLKSVTRGYGSFDFREEPERRPVKLARIDIEINGEAVDALSFVCRTDDAYERSKDVVVAIGKTMSRQNFVIDIRALRNGKIIASERLKAFRKDVLTKGGKTVGGGDESRKKKLLEKQKAGKKRMKMVGNVELSEKSFLAVMSINR